MLAPLSVSQQYVRNKNNFVFSTSRIFLMQYDAIFWTCNNTNLLISKIRKKCPLCLFWFWCFQFYSWCDVPLTALVAIVWWIFFLGDIFNQKPPSGRILKPSLEILSGIDVFSQGLRSQRANRWNSKTFVSIKANLLPMHILGPSPKGR